MSASDHGSEAGVLRDAMARTEMVFAHILDRPEAWDIGGREAREAIRTEIAALRSARARADARAKLAAPEMGGCVLDLSDPEEARVVREALLDRAAYFDGDGQPGVAAMALRIRKRISAGVVRNAERRTATNNSEG